MAFFARFPSFLGPILLRSHGQGLAGLYFVGQKDCPVVSGLPAAVPQGEKPSAGTLHGLPMKTFKVFKRTNADLFDGEAVCPSQAAAHGPDGHQDQPGLVLMQADTPASVQALFERSHDELVEYFEGRRQSFTVPLDLQGTAFQKRVWEALLAIPFGSFVSYGEVARTAGLSGGHGRAVGTAVGRNPLTIIVPCHRVLSTSGTLNGYSGGLARKLALLQLEGFNVR